MAAAKRSESFDLLRLVAAMMVLCSHQFPLNGLHEPQVPYFDTFGGVGVMIFFSLSGYLNCQSIFRSKSGRTFIFNRALRIVPGLFVCSILCIMLGAAVTTYSLTDYLTSFNQGSYSLPATLMFLIKNTFPIYRVSFDLPGVFLDNHFKGAINGSLWTLPYEVKCYLLLALAVVILKFNNIITLRALTTAIICLVMVGFFVSLDKILLREWTLKFLIVFSMGAAVALVEDKYGPRAALTFGLVVPLAFILSSNFRIAALTGIAVPILLTGWIANLPKFMAPKLDISYGVYIYAFPVQQYVSTLDLNWYLNLVIVLVITTVLGILSAILVERPALRWKLKLTRRELKSANVNQEAMITVPSAD